MITKKSDTEIQKILENRTDTELKNVCDEVIKQADSGEFANDFPNRIRHANGETRALLGLGAINIQNSQFPPALEYLTQALAIAEKTGDRQSQADAVLSMAGIYRTKAEYDKALEFYGRALTIYKELDASPVIMVLEAVGAVNMYLGDYTKAETAHREALSIAEKRNSKDGIADALFISVLSTGCAEITRTRCGFTRNRGKLLML